MSLLAAGSWCVPLPACKPHIHNEQYTLTDEHKKELEALLDILLPDSGDGISAGAINGIRWIEWTLSDECYPPALKRAILEGLEEFRQYARGKFNDEFSRLNPQQKTQMLSTLAEDNSLKYWLAQIITLLLEALLCHPIYGGNPEQIGWKWLGHTPGTPPPTPKTKYPELLAVRLQEKHMPTDEV